jgi:hypothetical protein
MNRDYSKGKIYKIVVDTDAEYKPYVGSTVQGLAERMGGHRCNYKKWKKGGKNCSSFDLFDRFGVENCKIILLEEYPCDSIMKLLMKEREWFEKIECCNKVIPYRSVEEKVEYQKEIQKKYRDEHKEERVEYDKIYQQKNKEQIAEQKKIHYEANKEKIAERYKIYYEANKEIRLEKAKIYRESNKEIIDKKKKETYECPCGSICCISVKARHELSLKHQKYLSTL